MTFRKPLSIDRHAMCSAVERAARTVAVNLLTVESPHRRSGHELVESHQWHLAILIICSPHVNHQVALGLVIANALNMRASRRIRANERSQVDSPAKLHVDHLVRDGHCEQGDQHACYGVHHLYLAS